MLADTETRAGGWSVEGIGDAQTGSWLYLPCGTWGQVCFGMVRMGPSIHWFVEDKAQNKLINYPSETSQQISKPMETQSWNTTDDQSRKTSLFLGVAISAASQSYRNPMSRTPRIYSTVGTLGCHQVAIPHSPGNAEVGRLGMDSPFIYPLWQIQEEIKENV